LDRSRRIPKENHIFDNQVKTIVISEESFQHENAFCETIDFNRDIPDQLIGIMHRHHISSVIVEGGTHILQSFIKQNLWDEARVIKGRTSLLSGVRAPVIRTKPIESNWIAEDQLLIFTNYD